METLQYKSTRVKKGLSPDTVGELSFVVALPLPLLTNTML